MAGTNINVTQQAMATAIQGFSDASANAKKTMNDLENELVSTLSNYAGDQATAFWQLHTQLQDKMKQASNELDTMSNLVTTANSNYNSGDSAAQQSFRQVASNLSGGGAAFSRITGGA